MLTTRSRVAISSSTRIISREGGTVRRQASAPLQRAAASRQCRSSEVATKYDSSCPWMRRPRRQRARWTSRQATPREPLLFSVFGGLQPALRPACGCATYQRLMRPPEAQRATPRPHLGARRGSAAQGLPGNSRPRSSGGNSPAPCSTAHRRSQAASPTCSSPSRARWRLGIWSQRTYSPRRAAHGSELRSCFLSACWAASSLSSCRL